MRVNKKLTFVVVVVVIPLAMLIHSCFFWFLSFHVPRRRNGATVWPPENEKKIEIEKDGEQEEEKKC